MSARRTWRYVLGTYADHRATIVGRGERHVSVYAPAGAICGCTDLLPPVAGAARQVCLGGVLRLARPGSGSSDYRM